MGEHGGDAVAALDASVDLLPRPAAVGAARRIVGDLMDLWGTSQDVMDTQLLVGELVTNAVRHAGRRSVLVLQLHVANGWLRIALADGSPVHPAVRELPDQQPGGWGLRLVEAVASRWGSETHGGGKRVWFEIAPPDTDSA